MTVVNKHRGARFPPEDVLKMADVTSLTLCVYVLCFPGWAGLKRVMRCGCLVSGIRNSDSSPVLTSTKLDTFTK